MFCAPRLVFDGTEGVWSRFNDLCSRTHFRRCRVCRVPFSCLVLQDSFSAVPRSSGPVFTFCAPGLVSGGIGDVGCHFLILRARTRFQRFRGRRVPFSSFARPDSFSFVSRSSDLLSMFYDPGLIFDGNEGRQVPFSYFACNDSFSAVSSASDPVFMFSALRHVFGGIEGVGSLFHVLRSRTRFRWYRGRQVPFSRFTFQD
jgi:hypothetical protein